MGGWGDLFLDFGLGRHIEVHGPNSKKVVLHMILSSNLDALGGHLV